MPEKTNKPIKRRRPTNGPEPGHPRMEFRAGSLKAVAELLDTTRSSARRWPKEGGIQPISLGRGAKGAIRYRWSEVESWLQSRQPVD
jgi:predicted DNA-binding transcriptional regulator AlpA